MSAVGNTYLLNLLNNLNIIFKLNYAYLINVKDTAHTMYSKNYVSQSESKIVKRKERNRNLKIVKPTVELRRKNNVNNQRIYSLKQLHNNILGINSLVY